MRYESVEFPILVSKGGGACVDACDVDFFFYLSLYFRSFQFEELVYNSTYTCKRK